MGWFEFDDFSFEVEARSLRKSGQNVPLTPKAGDLLLLFLENSQQLISKEEIKRRIWPDSTFVEDHTLLFQMSAVRTALGRRENGEAYIETLPKRGYRFVAHVEKHGVCEGQVEARAVPDRLPVLAGPQPVSTSPIEASQAIPPKVSVRRLSRLALIGVLLLVALATSLASLFPPRRQLHVVRNDPLTNDTRESVSGPLFTDGARVYFRKDESYGSVLAYVAIAGGGTGVAFPIGHKSIEDLAPLSSDFLAIETALNQDDGPIWVISLAGGSRRLIGDLRARSAHWSPDKQRIAFTLGSDLYVAHANGSEPRKIAAVPGDADMPRWSPDGKKVCFTEYNSVQSQTSRSMWEVSVDGSNQHPLLKGWSNPENEVCKGWTPDGNFLIFESIHNGRSDVWVLPKTRGPFAKEYGEPITLTSGLQGFTSPLVSLDGKHIFAIGVDARGKLERYDTKLREFLPFLNGIRAMWVTFSPSRQSVAYVDYADRTVWRQNLDGSEKKQITFSPLVAEGLSWSPDGKWFAMRAHRPGEPWRIQLVPADGGQPTEIVPGQGEQAIPSWSADNKHIAFGDVPRYNGKESGHEVIHVLDLSTRTLHELPGSRGLWTARYSPDGRFLSALTVEGERLKLYDFATRKWRATQADHIKNPTWSLDGKYVYYDTETYVGHENRSLCRVRVADGRVEELVSLQGHAILDATWTGVTPDNSPLILSDAGIAEIYSLALESRW